MSERFEAQALATPEAFQQDPDLVWGWYEWRRMLVQQTVPNPGHLAVVAIQARAPHTVVVTQNVDDLHERAGSHAVIHLHGSLFAPRCSGCARPASFVEDLAREPQEGRRVPPPGCVHCGESVRPGVVWFGESLPPEALAAAVDAASSCDLLLSVGTSGVVYPAAEIPQVAARLGATVIQVNPQETPLDAFCTVNLRGPAARVLPALVDAGWPSEVTASDLFEPEPPRWGLRGDPYVWREMRDRLAGTEFPGSVAEVTRLLHATFTRLVGVDLDSEVAAFVRREEFAHGGMSSGMVSIETWRDRLMPLLIERAAARCRLPR